MKEHLEFGTDVNAVKDGRTCLHTAAWLGYTELAKLPIAGGAELDSVDDNGVFFTLFMQPWLRAQVCGVIH
ncbi:ankyrin repeat domain-containing protein [bacterium]|nr:ankyrin repeat domain-containing protein [bacterium]